MKAEPAASTAPDPRPKLSKGERTRAKLVAATAELLTRQGYHATGLAQIVEVSGAPRGSLYFYFPGGKEELAIAALEASGAEWRAWIEGIVDGEPDLGDAVVAVCRALADALMASDFQLGCPLATVALEGAATSPAVRAKVDAHFAAWKETIAAKLESVGVAPLAAPELATFVMAAYEGAMLLAKASRDPQPLLTVGSMLRSMMALAPIRERRPT
jgi:TetR/AcrR family transcriptional regulator, lmrAB and yxaGH operons repressor